MNPGYFNSRDFYWWVSCSCSCACSCTCCSGILFFRDTGGHVLPHNSAEPEHGQVHRNEDDGDEQADEQDQDWLEHTSERAEAVFELSCEHIPFTAQHLRETSGLLADA